MQSLPAPKHGHCLNHDLRLLLLRQRTHDRYLCDCLNERLLEKTSQFALLGSQLNRLVFIRLSTNTLVLICFPVNTKVLKTCVL
jgi:hypothetical protein